jgi:hypothetical protein
MAHLHLTLDLVINGVDLGLVGPDWRIVKRVDPARGGGGDVRQKNVRDIGRV